MAVALNPRAERLLARLPRLTVYSALELLLLVLLAVQCARLFWALLTPIGPVGEWKDLAAMRLAAAPAPTEAVLGTFDPFFRQAPGAAAGAAPAVVTTLNLRLSGVREDRATGRGTAFITLANGSQQAFVVGEEIEPGVVLSQVGFDNITITRGGSPEQLFLDQSPAGAAAPGGQASTPAPPPPQPMPIIPVPPPPPPPPAPTSNLAQPTRVNQ